MKHKTFLIVIVLAALSSVVFSQVLHQRRRGISGETTPPIAKELTFETIVEGRTGPYPTGTRENAVITTKTDWKNLWDTLYGRFEPKPSLPEVDFAHHMVVAVLRTFPGEPGHDAEVVSVVEHRSTVEVFVKERLPGLRCPSLPVITHLAHIVKTKKTRKAPTFQIEQVEEPSCK